MSEKGTHDSKSLEHLIATAVKKIGGKKENNICRYLPASTGGYVHHFTMRKMKTEAPEELASLITKYIINADKPLTVKPKSRTPRSLRKRRDQVLFTKQDIDALLGLARAAGVKELVRKLTPRNDLRSIKRELISSIRHGLVEADLWHVYAEAVGSQQPQAVSAAPQLAGSASGGAFHH